jgi:hypothetical protein
LVLGMGERPNELLKLQNRAGPSVNQHQRYGVGARRALMDKINSRMLSIKRGRSLRRVDPNPAVGEENGGLAELSRDRNENLAVRKLSASS